MSMRDIVITCCMLKVCTSQNRMILLLLVRPYVTHCVYKCVLDTVRLHSFSSFRGGKEKKNLSGGDGRLICQPPVSNRNIKNRGAVVPLSLICKGEMWESCS